MPAATAESKTIVKAIDVGGRGGFKGAPFKDSRFQAAPASARRNYTPKDALFSLV